MTMSGERAFVYTNVPLDAPIMPQRCVFWSKLVAVGDVAFGLFPQMTGAFAILVTSVLLSSLVGWP